MNKSVLVLSVTVGSLISVIPGFADTNQSGDNKVVNASKKVGRGIMWAPKKIGNGMKTLGEKSKNAFHKSSKPKSSK
jgi:hypothetical protein